VGHHLVDEFLEFAASRGRPNTVRAYAHDLKTFFTVVGKDPLEVRPADVMGFVTAQRRPRLGAEKVVRISDGGSGLSTATIRRRLAAVSALYGYLITRGDVGVETNPVPRGLPTRASRREVRGKLLRPVRRLPRILGPGEVGALMAALRTDRDRAMVQAMVLGGLHRAEVIGLRLEDLRLGEWRVFIAEGKGGHQRLVPV
jgi:site-specific recombinase XerD